MALSQLRRHRRILGVAGLVRLELLRLAPRHRELRWQLFGRPLRLVDSASAYWSVRGIFLDEEYAFASANPAPRIVDVGASIGLSVLYFKRLYPQSRITAFEADPSIFQVLQENVRTFGYGDVELIGKAVWTSDGEMSFAADGADGGSLTPADSQRRLVRVPTTRLRTFLSEPVDFLKIDIEGAETAVLEDCADLLSGVRFLFVEYHSLAGKPQTLHRLLAVLQAAGFRVALRPASPVSGQPFLQLPRTEGLDLQLNIFASRESPA